MADTTKEKEVEGLPILPGDVPVIMPELPAILNINTVEQFKAMNDKVRTQILKLIRHQPATAKQLADRLGATPGAIGHHMHVLEAAGLAQVVALRVTRGIIARYYTRTARIFMYDSPQENVADGLVSLKFLNEAREELTEAALDYPKDSDLYSGFPHARISRARAEQYADRLRVVLEELFLEPEDPEGEVYALVLALFKAPAWQRRFPDKEEADNQVTE